MRYVADRTGRFTQRPHYEPKELDELIAMNYRAYGSCRACGRHELFDLGRLRERFGGDKRLSDLVARMRCTSCGGLGIGLTIAGR